VIAATNRDLETAIEENTFRSDLLSTECISLEVPPLRERPEDIPLPRRVLYSSLRQACRKEINRISKKTLNIVESYGWPGNVRELQNVVERA
jgi:transcriptional regulator with GAF, ATPase, and Fis domain